MSTDSKHPSVMVVGAGAAGFTTGYQFAAIGGQVYQFNADHFTRTTHSIAAGLYEPVGVGDVQPDFVPGGVTLLSPVDATREGIEFARAHREWGAVSRPTILLGHEADDVDVTWADAVDGFRPVDVPAGAHGYRHARGYVTEVVQSDRLRLAMLRELRGSGRWQYARRRFGDLDDVLRVAAELRVDAVVVAAGNAAGRFHEAEDVDPAIGIVAKVRHDRPIPADQPVMIATTDRVFPYVIPAYDLVTYGGTFIEGYGSDELPYLRVEDFGAERAEIVERLAALGVEIPAHAEWMLGARPVHPFGPHIRVDVLQDLPVLHLGGLSGSGATFATTIGRRTTEIVLELLGSSMTT